VRGLFDEQIIWEMICEEFPSKPVFNYQIVKPMNGPGAFCLLFGGPKSRLFRPNSRLSLIIDTNSSLLYKLYMTEIIKFPSGEPEPEAQATPDSLPAHRPLKHYARLYPEDHQLGYIQRIPKPKFIEQSVQTDNTGFDESE
jgi:hypothetical protein